MPTTGHDLTTPPPGFVVSTTRVFLRAKSPFSSPSCRSRQPASQSSLYLPFHSLSGRPHLGVISFSADSTEDVGSNEDSISKDEIRFQEEITSENSLLRQNDPLNGTNRKNLKSITLKQNLLKALSAFTDGGLQRQELEALIVSLESLKNIPATEAFTEIALAGEWKLLFSSINMRPGGNVRIREIGQIFDIEKRILTNKVLWSFTGADNIQQIRAHLYVKASYSFQSAGRLQVRLMDHTVIPEPQEDGSPNLMPKDLRELIRQLQRALPIEFFDPSGLVEVTYLEPQFRLAKVMGKKVAGVRNVFVKRGETGVGTGQQ